ncbi:hypothetical protein ANN_04389 [Periplaneta americana]|uniref:Uncharacterized protein n=1 Tax=Periplaneta americana TaxID=6978 RepID=A0ABQ8T8E7_PERAM|nr:hypothetical protein ANN_04389 [Periplaneta americana]
MGGLRGASRSRVARGRSEWKRRHLRSVVVQATVRRQFKVCHGSLYAVMWLADEPREFNLPTLPQRCITYEAEKLPSKYGVHSEDTNGNQHCDISATITAWRWTKGYGYERCGQNILMDVNCMDQSVVDKRTWKKVSGRKSGALYGAKTWTLRLSEDKRLEAVERRMERVKWTDRIRNESVLERVDEDRIMLILIRKRKRNWLSHWLRRNCLLKGALEGMVNGRKFRDRRRHQMIDDIKIQYMDHILRLRGTQNIGKIVKYWVCSERPTLGQNTMNE